MSIGNSGHGDNDLKQDPPAAGFPGAVRCVAAAFAACFVLLGTMAPAMAEKRTLKLFNTHTHETLTITFKKNGRYIPSALRELNRFLRDWRRNEATKMDPELFDLVWDVYRKSGAKKPIHVVSAYRSPATNGMLRKRSRGVARNSQHTRGRAMDYFIPGVSVAKLRAAGLRKEVGGVGYYPRSRTPFVHMDTGRVRHWPRMTRKQLARVFPNGKTIHVPSDGKPMPRYKQALAELNRREARSGKASYAREKAPSRRKQRQAIQVAKREKPAEEKKPRNTAKPVVAAAFDPVSDDDDVVLTPTARKDSGANAREGGNLFSGIASRLTGDDARKKPPGNIPDADESKSDKPTAQSDVAPGVTKPENAPEPEQTPEKATPEPIVIAATPLSKPARAAQPDDPATVPGAEAQIATADSATEPQAGDPALVLASADSAPATLPPVGGPTVEGAVNSDPQAAPASGNPADFVVAALPPQTRTRSFVQTGDPIAAANEIISGRTPSARPLIKIDEPLAYANATTGGPIGKPILPDRNIVGSTLSAAASTADAEIEPPMQVAALNPRELSPRSQTPVARKAPARAMPIIGDLRSLLDADKPFAPGIAFGKLLTTNTTTRTLVFAELRHPEVESIGSYLEKPQRILKRTFAEGFQSELRTDRFTGAAVGVIRSIFTP